MASHPTLDEQGCGRKVGTSLGGLGWKHGKISQGRKHGKISQGRKQAKQAEKRQAAKCLGQKCNLPVWAKTLAASGAANTYWVTLIPIDALKTGMQVAGQKGIPNLLNKIRLNGPSVLYHGAGATVSASWVGYYPWFLTYNYMDAFLPKYEETHKKLGRNALIGFSASVVSDSISNTLCVIKTTKQTYEHPITYTEAAKQIVHRDGVLGLVGRGPKTRIMCNGLQGMLFAVAWRYIMEQMNDNE